MPLEKHLHTNRYELKYLVDEITARGTRDFVRGHLQRDCHAVSAMRYSYPVYSLYLDSPGMMLRDAAFQGHRNRYKLRLRYYDDKPHTPVFFEIKRRVNDVIIKESAAARKASVRELLLGRCPQPRDLMDAGDVGEYSVLRRFSELQAALGATPRVCIYFDREAWVSREGGDEHLRVTFDRNIVMARYDGTLHPKSWHQALVPSIILELKFADRYPVWMRELSRSWDLYRVAMCKYLHCTEQMSQTSKMSPGSPMSSIWPMSRTS